ncbi:receptor kinase-like protein Xa21 [Elaeis guineensis]|uniref:Receptor kinase-like protein Xa21 n=1 Tax=Elaeis guineensis var. tenera TaxID=51953 RepID=A0A6I9Q9F7_ELAGV|nr:probable LRR receptor-like serine/threonine-protein kinase At3g47570 [Elaeis guineensis]
MAKTGNPRSLLQPLMSNISGAGGCMVSLPRESMELEQILKIGLILFFLWSSSCLPVASVVDATGAIQFRNDTDHLSLLAFKDQITHDPLNALSSWNDTIQFCNWKGVTCSWKHKQRVVVLDLGSLGLGGSLSPSIGNLTFLHRLNLGGNSFFSEIPLELGRLRRLKNLNLSFNSFQGGIPSNLTYCSELRILGLSNNQLTGKIPVEITSLTKLGELYLGSNTLIGVIPTSIGNLSSLTRLSFGYNHLGGSIPDDIGRLTTLELFDATDNGLTGRIPSKLYNISSLQEFSVAANKLQGSISFDMGIKLPSLQELHLGGNQFYGPIPITLANASRLKLIDIPDNHFSGGVPSELGRLRGLYHLNLETNQLEAGDANGWEFLDSLTNCSELQVLSLHDNMLRGMLPNSVVNLSSQLQVLLLDENYISGRIPNGIENLANLYWFTFHHNLFTGAIPESIGKLARLQKLYLSSNRFTGQIPISLGNLTLLTELHLYQNYLQGPISPSLGKLQHLSKLDLSANHLTGTIPKEILSIPALSLYLDLSDNSLVGSLPAEVGRLKNLPALDISGNMLSGNIPSTLGDCEMLLYLYLDNNFFQGTIPQYLSNARGLQELDLSDNNLTGPIPTFLEDLKQLQMLNLSFNHLEGEVPVKGVFKNATQVSIKGNRRLCGGVPELHLPACPEKSYKKRKWPLLLKIVIPIAGAVLCMILLFSFFILLRKRKSKVNAPIVPPLEHQFLRVSYTDLIRATDGFSSTNLIGRGGYGSVYKGILSPHQTIVAVKVFNLQNHGASKSFLAECEVLRSARHRNLVKVMTCCSMIDFRGHDFKALVFEFIPNGNLEKWLHPELDRRHHMESLSLLQRLNIAIDVADAVDYLHNNCQPSIVHCDLKPSNILIDNEMIAHVGDFGLARFMSKATTISLADKSSSIRIKGTLGYIAPEYGASGQVSTSGDVYSYGILLFEMLTGKSPVDDMFKDDLSLRKFVEMAFPETVMAIVDPLMPLVEDESKTRECLISMIRIGLSCSNGSVKERLNISNVATTMHAIRDAYLGTRVH